jgi:hypothetical protein
VGVEWNEIGIFTKVTDPKDVAKRLMLEGGGGGGGGGCRRILPEI